jgi:putative transposase
MKVRACGAFCRADLGRKRVVGACHAMPLQPDVPSIIAWFPSAGHGMACPYERCEGRRVTYDPERHHRRSIRLRSYDYSAGGCFFVTICTHNRDCLLGAVENDCVDLSAFGHLTELAWEEIRSHFPRAELDEFVIMPNHVHGIILNWGEPGMPCHAPTPGAFAQPTAGTISAVIRSFKSAAARAANEVRGTPGAPLWQRGFYEHLVRNDPELDRIRRYIATNPSAWNDDEENQQRSPPHRL